MLAVRRVDGRTICGRRNSMTRLDVTTAVTGLGAATIDLDQAIRRNAEELCQVSLSRLPASGAMEGRCACRPIRAAPFPDTTILKQK